MNNKPTRKMNVTNLVAVDSILLGLRNKVYDALVTMNRPATARSVTSYIIVNSGYDLKEFDTGYVLKQVSTRLSALVGDDILACEKQESVNKYWIIAQLPESSREAFVKGPFIHTKPIGKMVVAQQPLPLQEPAADLIPAVSTTPSQQLDDDHPPAISLGVTMISALRKQARQEEQQLFDTLAKIFGKDVRPEVEQILMQQ